MIDRFWAKVQEAGPDECWIWAGAHCGYAPHRYGVLRSSGTSHVKAHRLSWELANAQPVPAGMEVCHSCDNTMCVNPAHLFVGTHSDNMRDMQSKSRHPNRGKKPRLTTEQVAEIRRRSESGEGMRSIAKDMPVSRSQIQNVLRGRALCYGHWPGVE